MSLLIKDLEDSVELDRQAMRQIVGGSKSARLGATLFARDATHLSAFARAHSQAPRSESGRSNVKQLNRR